MLVQCEVLRVWRAARALNYAILALFTVLFTVLFARYLGVSLIVPNTPGETERAVIVGFCYLNPASRTPSPTILAVLTLYVALYLPKAW